MPGDIGAPRPANVGSLLMRQRQDTTHGGLPPAIPKADVRWDQPARSSYNADFAGLNDSREIALAEVQICPDAGGWVAVGRIEQLGRPLRQRRLRQQSHQDVLSDPRVRQARTGVPHYMATEPAA